MSRRFQISTKLQVSSSHNPKLEKARELNYNGLPLEVGHYAPGP